MSDIENNGETSEIDSLPIADIAEDVPEQKNSIEDTVRETFKKLTAAEESSPEAPSEVKPEKVRDGKGKFSKSAPEEDASLPSPDVEAADNPRIDAPKTWRKEAAELWQGLPQRVQAEIAKREEDAFRGIEQYKNDAQSGKQFKEMVAPYMATIQSIGVAPEAAVQTLLAADHKLRYGSEQEKTNYLAYLAKSYGINPANIASTESSEPVDRNYANLQQQVQQLSGWIQQKNYLEQQNESMALQSQISTFSADPQHKYFDQVKGQMAALLQAGQASDLKEAYDQAVWANSNTRETLIAERQAAAREEATKKVQEAKAAASVNVKRRPSYPTKVPTGTMQDTVRHLYQEMMSSN